MFASGTLDIVRLGSITHKSESLACTETEIIDVTAFLPDGNGNIIKSALDNALGASSLRMERLFANATREKWA